MMGYLLLILELTESSTAVTLRTLITQMSRSQISGEAASASGDGGPQHQGRGPAVNGRLAEAGLPVLLKTRGCWAGGWGRARGHWGPGPGWWVARAGLRMRGDDLVHPGVRDANTVNHIQQVLGVHGQDVGRGEHSPAMFDDKEWLLLITEHLTFCNPPRLWCCCISAPASCYWPARSCLYSAPYVPSPPNNNKSNKNIWKILTPIYSQFFAYHKNA